MGVYWEECPAGARVLRVLSDTPCPAVPGVVAGLPVVELGPYCFADKPVKPGAQRTGTDNLPVLNTPVVAPPTHDYSGLSTPSVWRTGRTAAAKVDALASNGMDEIEIPAFLRKQAD